MLDEGAVDLDRLAREFLAEASQGALRHFKDRSRQLTLPTNLLHATEHRTVQLTVPAGASKGPCSGTIVAYVSAPAFAEWTAVHAGPPADAEQHVLDQLRLVLQDLSDHDVHGCLALTETQCDVYDLDLMQLVAESLDRTTFSRLRRPADIHWEGTLVKSLDPPALVLVLSIDL